MSVKVGLLGHGTVGSAFKKLLTAQAAQIEALTGSRPEVVGTLTRSQGSFQEILDRSDVVVELIGGVEPAKEYVLAALNSGRHVLTANKQLLAQHGEELWAAARSSNVHLGFEAAVAGVIPVIRVVTESLAGAKLDRVLGIVNGTTNFILTQMSRTGASYQEALAEAQRLGYAEADPTDDVNGKDAAAKMAVLSRLTFGSSVSLDQVSYEGIEHVTPEDIEYAKEFGLSLKLIGTAEVVEDGLSVRVYPAFLYGGHPLATVNGSFNAVTVESEAIKEITMSGPGAGGVETASAVLGDLVTAVRGPVQIPAAISEAVVVKDVDSAFYLSLQVDDQPGALADIAQLFAEEGVSIKSVVQKELSDYATIVTVFHPVSETQFAKALDRVEKLDCVHGTPRPIRVIEEEFQSPV